MSIRITALAAVGISLTAALVYDIVFAAAACFPSFVDPVLIVAALPSAVLYLGWGMFIAAFAFLVAAQKFSWRAASFGELCIVALFVVIFIAAALGYVQHPHGVPCAI